MPAASSLIGGDLTSVRLGSGAIQIPGSGVWGEPRDHDEMIRVLRRVLEPEQRSPVLLSIPGPSTVAHLEENVGAALIKLTREQVNQLETAI